MTARLIDAKSVLAGPPGPSFSKNYPEICTMFCDTQCRGRIFDFHAFRTISISSFLAFRSLTCTTWQRPQTRPRGSDGFLERRVCMPWRRKTDDSRRRRRRYFATYVCQTPDKARKLQSCKTALAPGSTKTISHP